MKNKRIGMKRLLELAARAFHFRGYAISVDTGAVCEWGKSGRSIMADARGVVFLSSRRGKVTRIHP